RPTPCWPAPTSRSTSAAASAPCPPSRSPATTASCPVPGPPATAPPSPTSPPRSPAPPPARRRSTRCGRPSTWPRTSSASCADSRWRSTGTRTSARSPRWGPARAWRTPARSSCAARPPGSCTARTTCGRCRPSTARSVSPWPGPRRCPSAASSSPPGRSRAPAPPSAPPPPAPSTSSPRRRPPRREARARSAGLDQPRLVGEDHRLHPVAQVELGQHLSDVRLDRRLGDDEPLGDLPVRQALGDELEHLALTCRQTRQGRVVRPGGLLLGRGGQPLPEELEHPPGDPRGDDGIAAGDGADRGDERLGRGV